MIYKRKENTQNERGGAMPPSSDGGGGAAPERTPNARADAIVDRVNPSYTHTLKRRRLRGVGYIEPNDEIGQWPAVLSLPSLVAICWIVLERFEWSGNWVVITPNMPSFAPSSTPVGRRSEDEHGNGQRPRRKDILVLVRQSMSDFTEAIEDWPMQNDIP